MFESKLREALELATQKSAAGRVKAMEAICGAFLKRYCPDFVENQQVKYLSTQIIIQQKEDYRVKECFSRVKSCQLMVLLSMSDKSKQKEHIKRACKLRAQWKLTLYIAADDLRRGGESPEEG